MDENSNQMFYSLYCNTNSPSRHSLSSSNTVISASQKWTFFVSALIANIRRSFDQLGQSIVCTHVVACETILVVCFCSEFAAVTTFSEDVCKLSMSLSNLSCISARVGRRFLPDRVACVFGEFEFGVSLSGEFESVISTELSSNSRWILVFNGKSDIAHSPVA